MNRRRETISVVVPVYNSANTLPKLVDRLAKVLPTLTNQFELVLVNDASRDASWKCVQTLIEKFPWIRGIDLARNFGQHNALLCGIRAAKHEIIVTLDDDLQNPPEEIPKLIAKLGEGFDVVYGCPIQERHSLWRDLSSQITKIVLQNVMGADTARHVSAFRAIRTPVREAFREYRSPFICIDVLLNWGTNRFTWMRVDHQERAEGFSNYTFKRLVLHALNMLTGFSTLPLQFASLLGGFLAMIGVGIFLFVLIRWLYAGSVAPGFPFLASIIAIFSGGQFLALGIIGEYISRMHFRMLEKPSYVVRTEQTHIQLQQGEAA